MRFGIINRVLFSDMCRRVDGLPAHRVILSRVPFGFEGGRAEKKKKNNETKWPENDRRGEKKPETEIKRETRARMAVLSVETKRARRGLGRLERNGCQFSPPPGHRTPAPSPVRPDTAVSEPCTQARSYAHVLPFTRFAARRWQRA